MAVFDLEERVEEAVKAVVDGLEIAGLCVVMAQEKKEITEPAVMISLPDSTIPEQEEALEVVTGNRQGTLTVGVRSHSDYGRAGHRELVGKVRDLFYDDEFAAALTLAATGVAVDRIEPVASERTVEAGNSFLTAIQAEVWFRPAPTE